MLCTHKHASLHLTTAGLGASGKAAGNIRGEEGGDSVTLKGFSLVPAQWALEKNKIQDSGR